LLLVGVAVAGVQLMFAGVDRVERARVAILAVLASFFGGTVLKAVARESLTQLSVASVFAAAATSALVLLVWRWLVRGHPAPRHP